MYRTLLLEIRAKFQETYQHMFGLTPKITEMDKYENGIGITHSGMLLRQLRKRNLRQN